ncbi:MAG: phosphoribosylanthranilate isomerase [Acidimicrobiales bacterium]|nr:phosphoribosylanthranilate isomerase [Acidimicrobiales bacterium]
MFVKICGITNEEDALLAVAVGADAVGFVFAPSPRQVSMNRVAEIVRRLPPDIMTVGVFRNEIPDRVISIVNNTGLMAAQLHGFESQDHVKEVKAEVRTVFKAVVAGSEAFQTAATFGADAILVDSEEPGSGDVFDWQMAENAPQGVPLILAGGLTPDNVFEAIAKVQPWGVDVSSGVERSSGVKDPILVRAFVQAARSMEPVDDPEGSEVRILKADPYNWEEDSTWR